MVLFRRRRDNRRNKPRPEGRLAAFLHGVVNVVFYCILSDAAVNNDGTQIIANEPSVISSISMAAKDTKKKFDTNMNANSQIHHRRTNHDPNDSHSLSLSSLSNAHSPASVGGLEEGKRNEQGKKTASLKRSSLSWFRKGSKTSKVKEEGCDIDTSQPAYPSVTSATEEHNSQSDSRFQILELVASPGGAPKRILPFNPEPFHSVHRATESSILSFGSIDVSVSLDSQTSASHVVPHHTTLDTTNKTSDCNTTTVSGMKLHVVGALETSDGPAHCDAPVSQDMSVDDEISVESNEIPTENDLKNAAQMPADTHRAPLIDEISAETEDFQAVAQLPEDESSPVNCAIPAESDGFQDGVETREGTDNATISNEIPAKTEDFQAVAQLPEDNSLPVNDAISAETDGFQDSVVMREGTDSSPFSDEIHTESVCTHTAPEAPDDLANSDTTLRE